MVFFSSSKYPHLCESHGQLLHPTVPTMQGSQSVRVWLSVKYRQRQNYFLIYTKLKNISKGLSFRPRKHHTKNKKSVKTWGKIIIDAHSIFKCQNMGRKWNISKTPEGKVVRDVPKDPRTAKSGLVVSKKTVTRALHKNGPRGCRPRK